MTGNPVHLRATAATGLRRMLLFLFALGGGVASACSIPVFRYALEQWRADPYEVLVYHRGGMSSEQSALLEPLSPEYVPGEPTPNVAVTTVDLEAEVRPEFAAIWEAERNGPLPWIVVRTPWRGENHTVWTGPLSAASIQTILASPIRAEVTKRLAEGDSIVWLLAEGNDTVESERLAKMCEAELARLEQQIALPQIRPEDLQTLSVNPDQLGLRFSLLRVRRDDARESLLIRALLTVQPGLDQDALKDQPMLFPVFGRGRAYFPLVGRDIEPLQLEDLARFLTGACQCTVKQQNPGVDLLTWIDWDAYVLGIETERPLPPLAGLADFSEPADDLAADPADDASETPSSTPPPVADTDTAAAQPIAFGDPAAVSDVFSINNSTAWAIGVLTAGVAAASLWLFNRPR